MPRAKRGFKARRRRNRVLRHAKGYYSSRSRLYGAAVEQVHNAWADAFAHRRRRKRDFRRLWITRIGAAARLHGMSYSRLVGALRRSGIAIDRKILADLALSDPGGFKAVLDAAGR
ncbi:MAG: 50S ribosomal protein L20 [Polyangiales bacterium]